MREKKFTRIAALLLCLTMLLGNAVIFASASDAEGSGGSITDVSLEELRELLNAISYEEYSDKNAAVPGATQTVEVPIGQFSTEDDGFEMQTKDGVNALFTPLTARFPGRSTSPRPPSTRSRSSTTPIRTVLPPLSAF